MQIPKLLIADGSEELRQALQEMFSGSCDVESCGDGDVAQQLLQDFAPDILVLDLMLPQTDGLSLLQQLYEQKCRPMTLVLTSLSSSYVVDRLQRLEVDYVMQKPCQMQALQVRIGDFIAQLQQTTPHQEGAEDLLSGVLLPLGISAKLDGYRYLLAAIPMYAQDPSQSITKELYVAVGQPLDKAPALVERSIRSAIE